MGSRAHAREEGPTESTSAQKFPDTVAVITVRFEYVYITLLLHVYYRPRLRVASRYCSSHSITMGIRPEDRGCPDCESHPLFKLMPCRKWMMTCPISTTDTRIHYLAVHPTRIRYLAVHPYVVLLHISQLSR
jgi:hypothetical protein